MSQDYHGNPDDGYGQAFGADGPGAGWTPRGEPAGLGRRFVARFLDGLIVGIPTALVLVLIPGIRPGGALGSAVSTIVSFGYFVWLESSKGRTLGKQALGLTVAGPPGGSPISQEASAKRNVWMLLGIAGGIPFLGALLGLLSLVAVIAIAVTIASDERNRGLHDRFADTWVLTT